MGERVATPAASLRSDAPPSLVDLGGALSDTGSTGREEEGEHDEKSSAVAHTPCNRSTKVGFGLVLAALWLPFLCLSMYAYPALDDFWESVWTDFLDLQKGRYLWYTGRFVGSLVQPLNPWHWESLLAYRITAGLRIVLFVVCLHVFFRAIGRCCLAATHRETLVLEVLFSASFLAGMASPSEFFYWYAASVLYLLPLCVLLLLAAMLLDQLKSHRNSALRDLLYCIGFFYLSGNVEMLPLLVLSITGPALVYAHLRSRELMRPLSIAFLATAVGLCINVLAPGNEVRQAQMDTAVRTTEIVEFSAALLSHTMKASARWCLDESIAIPALFAAPVFWALRKRGARFPNPVVIAAGTLFGLVVLYSGPLWGLGFTVSRVENVCLFMFLLGLYALVASLAAMAGELGNGPRLMIAWVVAILAVGLVAGLVRVPGTNKVLLAYREWSGGIAEVYEQSERERAEATKRFVGEDVIVPPLAAVARSLAPVVITLDNGGLDVLSEDPNGWWANRAYARYYRKRSIRVQHPGIPVPPPPPPFTDGFESGDTSAWVADRR